MWKSENPIPILETKKLSRSGGKQLTPDRTLEASSEHLKSHLLPLISYNPDHQDVQGHFMWKVCGLG